jgi:hypothetical protein
MPIELEGDGLLTDRQVAELLGKHIKTLKRWDENPKLKALGWPEPIDLNGRTHRNRPKLRAFLHNASLAHLSDSKTTT